MAVTVTQVKESTDGNIFETDGIEALAFDASVAVGSYVVVGIAVPVTTRTITSVVDSGSNTYALLSQGGQDATVEEASAGSEIWFYGAQVTSTTQTITVTISSALPAPAKMVLWELDGQHATTPVEDVAVGTSSATTSHSVGPVVTAAAGNVLIGMTYTGSSGVYTNDAGFTEAFNTVEGCAGHRTIGAASTSYVVTSAGNESNSMVLVAIKPATLVVVQTKTDAATQPWGVDAIAPITADSAFTVGNVVVLGFAVQDNRTVVSVVDDGSGGTNTYTLVESEQSPGAIISGFLYTALVERAASTITITISSATFAIGRLFLVELSGQAATDWIGGTNAGNTAGATTHVSGSVTVQASPSLIIGYTFGSVGAYTLDAAFTAISAPDATNHVAGYQTVTTDTTMTNTTPATEASVTLACEVLPLGAGTTNIRAIRLHLAQLMDQA